MSGYHSLSGFLFQKPAGALSRLKSKRKLWCVFEEGECELLYYKTKEESLNKSPIGRVNIKGAAIIFDSESNDQFIIMSKGKEYTFSAENHESMMIWLTGLQMKRAFSADSVYASSAISDVDCRLRLRDSVMQSLARRDSFMYKVDSSNAVIDIHQDPCLYGSLNRERSNSDISLLGRFRNYNKVAPAAMSCSSLTSSGRQSKTQLHMMGHTIDTGIMFGGKTTQRDHSQPNQKMQHQDSVTSLKRLTTDMRQLTPVSEEPWTSKSVSAKTSPVNERKLSVLPHASSSSMSAIDNDDVFHIISYNDDHYHTTEAKIITTSTKSSSVGVVLPIITDRNSEGSNDSAIEKESVTSLDISTRLCELERELVLAKCELAKVLNQQTSYAEIIQKKDVIIQQLETMVLRNNNAGDVTKCRRCTSKHELEEKVRVLKNQNIFLNKEIMKIAKLMDNEQTKYNDIEWQMKERELELHMWKRDYVSVIESSIHYPTGDTMDSPEVNLHSQHHHEKQVQDLLDDARTCNPSLPTYEQLSSSDVHVDRYGFKHNYKSKGLVIHYICRQLSEHYTLQLASYDNIQLQWKHFLFEQRDFFRTDAILKRLCRMGIPHQYRREVWRKLVYTKVKDIVEDKGPHYFRNLCNTVGDSKIASYYKKQISLDLMRTMPSNVKFSSPTSKGIMDLQDVLLAFCVHNPSVGYCQGINFIVAMALLISDAKDAFWMLVAISEKYFGTDYFSHNLIGAQADQEVLKNIIKEKLPRLHQHFIDIDIEISTITLNWFMAIFFDSVPFETLLRIWDCFLLEGPKVLFRCAVAILHIHETELLQKTDVIGVMKHLKACAKLTYNVDGLMKTAFEELEPFPRRRDIAIKQACFYNVLKEKIRRREEEQNADEHMLESMANVTTDMQSMQTIDCTSVVAAGKLWLSHGDREKASICEIDLQNNTIHNISIEMGARVLCMHALPPDIMCMGTISKLLSAFNTSTGAEVWCFCLHDSILCLASWTEKTTSRLFAGLANGTLAIIEGFTGKTSQAMEIIYLPIGKMATGCMAVRNDQLWCASGNEVHIIHARTLDMMDIFTVSQNPYDQILTLIPSALGVWISVKGSTVLELFNYGTLICKMLFDTFTCKHATVKKDEEPNFMVSRISSLLINDNTIWVGTGDGNLLIFDLIERCKTPTEASSSCESTASSPFYLRTKHAILNLDAKENEMSVNRLPVSPLTHDATVTLTQSYESIHDDNNDNERRRNNSGGGNSPEGDKNATMEIKACAKANNIESEMKIVPSSIDMKTVNNKVLTTQYSDSSGIMFEMSEDCQSPTLVQEVNEKIHKKNSAHCENTVNKNASRGLTMQDSGILSQTQTSSDEEPLLTFKDSQDVSSSLASNEKLDYNHVRELIDVKMCNTEENVGKINEGDWLFDKDKMYLVNASVLHPSTGNNTGMTLVDENQVTSSTHHNIGSQIVFEKNEDRTTQNFRPNNLLMVPQGKGITSDVSEFESTVETIASAEEDDVFFDTTGQGNSDLLRKFKSENNICDDLDSTLYCDENNESSVTANTLMSQALEKRREWYAQTKRSQSIATGASNIRYTLGSSNSDINGTHRQRQYKKLKCRKRQKKGNTDIDFRLDFSSFIVPSDASSCSTCPTDISDHSFSLDSQHGMPSTGIEQYTQEDYKSTLDLTQQLFSPSDPTLSHMPDAEFYTLTTSPPTTVDPWSSYDDMNLSTSTNAKSIPWLQKCVSHTPSTISLCSNSGDAMYTHEMLLQAKMKISDKAVKSITRTTCNNEIVIVTCAGCYGDDEAVLKWKKDKTGHMWTNELVYPVCPVTKVTKLPRYMQDRMMTLSVSSVDSTSSLSSVITSNQ